MIAAPNYNTIAQPQSPSEGGPTLLVGLKLNESPPPSNRHHGHLFSVCSQETSADKWPQRSVRFDLTPRCHFGRVELTIEEKHQMFWNAADIKRQARLEALLYLKNNHYLENSTTPYETIYNEALHTCCSIGRIENAHSIILSVSGCRGLEQFIVQGISKTRGEVVRRVLKAQSMLPAKLDRHQQAILLCGVSKNLTRSSRRMGQLFAIGDAQDAHADPY
mmetsp:Transcript_21104/g.32239  ORF Transcript_21104/g.32239 Transcript_21104/m.32239 type:complete len:220 (-) Transcript_21104:29-688(-)